jgi:hypothetical protein
MEQTESWDYIELFKKTIGYEAIYLLRLEKEGFIKDMMEFAIAIVDTTDIIGEMIEKMKIYFDNLNSIKREYFEDPDDPPVQRIGETLYFVKCDNYMTSFGSVVV